MKRISPISNAPLDRAFLTALLTLAVTVLGVITGYFIPPLLFDGTSWFLEVQRIRPYARCDFFAEYAVCAASLCRSVLIESLVLWLAPYTKFDIPLTSAVFLSRGLSLGVALSICRRIAADASVFVLPILYAVITAVFVLFSYSLRRTSGARPVRETCIHFLIASGFAFAVQILSPLIF